MTSPVSATRCAQNKPRGRIAAPHQVPSSRSALESVDLVHGLVPVAADTRLHYVRAGAGEPVLLIPGWPQSWYAWRFVIPLLASHGRAVYAVDPRGLGDSDLPDTGYDM